MAYRKLIQANPRKFTPFVPLGTMTYVACCDCGLVHDMQVRVRNGEFVMRLRRNNKRTNARRKQQRHVCR